MKMISPIDHIDGPNSHVNGSVHPQDPINLPNRGLGFMMSPDAVEPIAIVGMGKS